ncbi:MAG: leucine-rich repeat protein [Lachnospiraceae bacterium]|nr:leucine-rich repeat protein [Lachnospiraceae bacterium]
MRKNRPIAIILTLSFILSFLPQSEVRAVDTMAETEYQEEKGEIYSSSGTDETRDSGKSNETESVIQQDSGTSEPDIQDDAAETENDASEEYQEESSVQNATAGDYTYSVSSGKITITKYNGTEEIVEIPAEIDGVPVTRIGTRAFQNCTTIKQLTIPDGVTAINTGAFRGCENLEELYYNCSLTSMGTTPFQNCTSLKTIYFGENVSSFARNADNNCYGTDVETFVVDENNLIYTSKDGVLYSKRDDGRYDLELYPIAKKDESFTVSTDVATVDKYALSGNPYVREITIDGSDFEMNTIYALYNLSSMEKITLQGTYKYVYNPSNWVSSCESLNELYLYADLPFSTSIFSRCDNLAQIYIGADVTKVYGGLFGGTEASFHVDEENKNYISYDGVLFSKGSKKTLVKYPSAKAELSYTIPEDTEEIMEYAFSGCKYIQEISFRPINECRIEEDTFVNCTALENLELGGNITYVSGSAIRYSGVAEIKKLLIGRNIAEWSYISDLGEFEKLEQIQVEQGNPSYSSVDGILFDQTGKTLILYPSGKTADTYVVPETVETIDTYSFSGNHHLISIEIPETVTTIKSAPSDCTIIGARGSAAETYALEHDLPFVDMSAENEEGTPILPDSGTSVWDEGTTEEVVPEGNLYIVSNAAQLAWIGEQTRAGNDFAGKNVVLTADIDLDSQEWTPIGDNNNPFRGNFDGRNHTISNLKVTGLDYAGLFGAISSKVATQTVKISNVKIKNVQISGANYAGALVAYVRVYEGAGIQIDSCTVSGEVKGKEEIGGLLGFVYGGDDNSKIEINCINSNVNISVNSSGSAGGIVGRIRCEDLNENTYDGMIYIKDCKYNGSVLGTNGGWIGGIAGRAKIDNQGEVVIQHCKTEGKISFGTTGCAGGVIGYLSGTKGKIISCVNYASVTEKNYYSGGIAGQCYYGIIDQCCNEGTVQSNISGAVSGGIVGEINAGEIKNSYNTGSILGNFYFGYYPGGITGYNRGKIVNCYNIGILPKQTLSCMPGAMGSVVIGPTEYCYYNFVSFELAHLYGNSSKERDNPLIYSDASNGIVNSGGSSPSAMKSRGLYQTWDFSTIWEFDYNYSYGYPTLTSIKDLLKKHPDSDVKSDKDKNNQFTFTVLDQDSNAVEGATVTFGTEDDAESKETGKAGRAKFTYNTDIKGLVVEKEGYITYTDTEFTMNKKKEYTVPLFAEDTVADHPLSSVIMNLNGNRYELLSQTKTINRRLNNAEFSIFCTPSDNTKIYTKYEILQGEDVVAESATGEFSLTPEQFQVTKRDYSVYPTKIRLTDAGGNTCQEGINLTFVDEKEMHTSLEFGDGIEFTVGKDVPVFGNSKIKFDTFNVPVSVYVGEDKWRVTLNIANNDNADNVIKWFESSSDIMDNFKKVKDYLSNQAVISKNPKFTLELVGYAEGDMPMGTDEIDLKIFLKLTGKWSHEWQAPYAIVIGVDAKGSVSANGELTINTETIQLMDGNANVEGEFGLGLFAGMGMAKVLSAGIYGDGKIGLKYYLLPSDESGLDELYLSGKLMLVVRFLGNNVGELDLFDGEKTYWIYARDRDDYYVDGSSANSPYESAEQWMQSLGDMELSSAAESPAGEWTGSETVLQQTAYSESKPLLMQSGGDTIMLFTSNTLTDRDEAEASVLMYSIYDAASEAWSEPQPVDDDGTADFNPVVSGGYVAWNDSKGMLSGCTTLNQIGKQLEVTVASYNSVTKSFENVQTVTSNQSFENNLSLRETADGANLSWSINSEGDVFGLEGTNTMYFCTLTGNRADTKELTNTDQIILWREAGEIDGRACYLYIVDENNNLTDIEGQTAYAVFADNGEVVQLSTESMSAVCSLPDRNKILLISADGNIYTKEGLSGEIVQETEENPAAGTVQQIIEGENGDITILFTLNGENNANAYAMMYDSDLAAWSERMNLTDTDNYVEGISGGYVDGKMVFLYNQRELDMSDDNSVGTNSLHWSTVTNNTVQLADAEVDFFSEDAVNGAQLPIEISVKNTGMSACQAVAVTIGDGTNEILNETMETLIMPGETKTLELTVTVPELTDITEYEVAVVPKENEQGGCNTTITLGTAAYEVDRSLYCINGTYTLTVSVTNNCAEAGDGTIEIFDYNDPETVYETYSFTDLSSDDVLIYDTKIESLNWDEISYKKIGVRVVRDGQVNGDIRSVVVYQDNYIPVEEIKLNTTEVSLEELGSTYRLIARILPENISVTQAVWESSDETVASVDSSGIITAIGEGEADITVTVGDKSATCKVSVTEKKIIPGDIDANGVINLFDLMRCLNHVSGKSILTGDAFTAADVDQNGTVNLFDLMRILNYVSGKSATV